MCKMKQRGKVHIRCSGEMSRGGEIKEIVVTSLCLPSEV